MGSGYEFREDLLPMAFLVARRALRVEDIDGVMGEFRSLVERRIRYVSVADLRGNNEIPDALTRRRYGEEIARFEPFSRVWSLGGAVVVDSEIVRGALTAIQWVARPQMPMVYFSDLRPAVDWAVQRLEGAGLEVTPAIRAFRARLD